MSSKKSKGGKSGGIAGLIAFAFFLGVVYTGWRIHKTGALFDQSNLSGQFEIQVNEILSNHHISEKDILKELRIERKKNFPVPVLWIETEKEIFLPKKIPVESLIKEIKKSAEEINFKFLKQETGNGQTVLEIGKPGQVFQRIVFLGAISKERRVAIVIDDIAGRKNDLEKLDDFFSLQIPITFAVLPMEHLSRETSEKIKKKGHEVILHQPMEPEDMAHNNPGKAAILSTMSAIQIGEKFEKNLKTVPYASGISNHMGSRFTADEKAMHSLFSAIQKIKSGDGLRPFFFFDSYTSAKTVSAKVSLKTKVKILRNEIFLDGIDEPDAMMKQLDYLRKMALKDGSAIAIGHIQKKNMVSSLKKMMPKFKKDGIKFVYLSEFLNNKRSGR